MLKGLISSAAGVVLASSLAVASAAERPRLTLEPIRSRWPIMREAAGEWVVLGETMARNGRSRPITIERVTLKVLSRNGAVLAKQVASGKELAGLFYVMGFDPDGNPFMRAEGTTTLQPGDIGIAWLGTLAGRHTLPSTAKVRFEVAAAPDLEAAVPLGVFDPGQQLSWPARLESGLPWGAGNTFHPLQWARWGRTQGRTTIPPSRRDGCGPAS